MRYLLVHHDDDALGEHWRRAFAGLPDVEIVNGDICGLHVDAIVSPANSFGFMDGGLDHALSERFGWDLQDRLQQLIRARPMRELLVGETLVLPTGDATVPWLISAPTMRVPMRLRQSINAYLAMKAILIAARCHSSIPAITSIAIPGLGTGCGKLGPEVAALQMCQAFREIVLGEYNAPGDFGDAQNAHWKLNTDEIMIWD